MEQRHANVSRNHNGIAFDTLGAVVRIGLGIGPARNLAQKHKKPDFCPASALAIPIYGCLGSASIMQSRRVLLYVQRL